MGKKQRSHQELAIEKLNRGTELLKELEEKLSLGKTPKSTKSVARLEKAAEDYGKYKNFDSACVEMYNVCELKKWTYPDVAKRLKDKFTEIAIKYFFEKNPTQRKLL